MTIEETSEFKNEWNLVAHALAEVTENGFSEYSISDDTTNMIDALVLIDKSGVIYELKGAESQTALKVILEAHKLDYSYNPDEKRATIKKHI